MLERVSSSMDRAECGDCGRRGGVRFALCLPGPKAPQDVTKRGSGDALARTSSVRDAGDALAAALTPRELTDEEAERGARAIDPEAWTRFDKDAERIEEWIRLGYSDQAVFWRDKALKLVAPSLAQARAASRAITEEPAR